MMRYIFSGLEFLLSAGMFIGPMIGWYVSKDKMFLLLYLFTVPGGIFTASLGASLLGIIS
jgi:hypothetical protein